MGPKFTKNVLSSWRTILNSDIRSLYIKFLGIEISSLTTRLSTFERLGCDQSTKTKSWAVY